jgi:hypothetical protein
MRTKINRPKRGGARENAGRKPLDEAPKARGIRCTDAGWEWLQSLASGKGHTSVGKWADAAGRKAPKRKGNDQSLATAGAGLPKP